MALRQPRYLGILLAVSLALNLFVAGAFVGGWLTQRTVPTDIAGTNFSGLVAALPNNVRNEARAALDVREADLQLRLAALREARAVAEQAMMADPFFSDVLEAGLADVRARGGDVQTALHEVVVEMVEGLDAVDRAELADLFFAGAGELRLAGRTGSTVSGDLASLERR